MIGWRGAQKGPADGAPEDLALEGEVCGRVAVGPTCQSAGGHIGRNYRNRFQASPEYPGYSLQYFGDYWRQSQIGQGLFHGRSGAIRVRNVLCQSGAYIAR